MIVKVQVSLFDSEGIKRALIYDESRDFEVQFPASNDLLEVMQGRPKAFFEAEVVGTLLQLGEEVPDPGW